MAKQETMSPSDLLYALAVESQKQSALLEQMQNGARREVWEYLVVFVQAQREGWFEYWANGVKIPDLDNKPVYYVLNYIGSKGWELVSITPSGDFYFKRRKS